MKIILSPAKTLNLTNSINVDWTINELTKKIVKKLKLFDDFELKKILKISDKLLNINVEYIKEFDSFKSYVAIEMYNGLAYKVLKVNELQDSAMQYLNHHLLILSAFYGILKPNDLVKAYRLDFNSSLKIDNMNLKNFWKEYYNSFIKEGETVLNLASNEFGDLFDKARYDWYDFDFFEIRRGLKKKHSTISKKSRGKLLRELAINNIETVDEIYKMPVYGEFFTIVS